MPSEKVLKQKQAVVTELHEKLIKAAAGVIVDYKGISVEADTRLRKELRESDIEYIVVKNTIFRRAIIGTDYEGLEEHLKGSTALAISYEDPVKGAKILQEFVDKKKKKQQFHIKTGFVDGGVIDAASVKSLAKLPSKEVLVAQVLAGFNAPISGFANVLVANLRGLVVALNAIAEKQGA